MMGLDGKFQVVALIPAAGEGRRMGAGATKVLRQLGDEPVLVAAVRALQAVKAVEAVFIITPPGDGPAYREQLIKHGVEVHGVIDGGTERQHSVYNGLKAVQSWPGWQVPQERRFVAIHDAARPLVESRVIEKAICAAVADGAVGVGVPVKDTIKRVDTEGWIQETPPRERLWAIQTPQVFRLPLIINAHEKAANEGYVGTDDCVLVERLGYLVRVVEGDYCNLKVTTPEDMIVAEALRGKSMEYRIGQGFDVHRLVPERGLIMGGVTIDFELGLLGHSDADVLIHALMDALLGAVGLGDIGCIFPDTAPAFKDADSRKLLVEVVRRVREAGGTIVNVDATIIAQRPKMAPHIPQMKENLAEDLCIPVAAVNVKATTTEGLGFTGRGEGIAAQAVAMVKIKQ